MCRHYLAAVLAVSGLVTVVQADLNLFLPDEFDDLATVFAVADSPKVAVHRKELDFLRQQIRDLKESDIIAILGKPKKKPAKQYAMPVAQDRSVTLLQFRPASGPDKDHTEFYPVGDYAGVEVYYGFDGVSPSTAVFYVKADKTFPKLTKENLEKRLTWDQERINKLTKLIAKKTKERRQRGDKGKGKGKGTC